MPVQQREHVRDYDLLFPHARQRPREPSQILLARFRGEVGVSRYLGLLRDSCEGADDDVADLVAVQGSHHACRPVPFVCVQPMVPSWSRRTKDLTCDKADEKDAVLIARLTAQLRCYLPSPSTRRGPGCGIWAPAGSS